MATPKGRSQALRSARSHPRAACSARCGHWSRRRGGRCRPRRRFLLRCHSLWLGQSGRSCRPVAFGVLQGDQKPARRGRVVVVVETAPGVGVDDPVGSYREVPGMAELVCEDGGAEARRERDAAVIPDAGARARRRCCAGRLSMGPSCRQQQSCDEDGRGSYGQASYKSCARFHFAASGRHVTAIGAFCKRSPSSLAPDGGTAIYGCLICDSV